MFYKIFTNQKIKLLNLSLNLYGWRDFSNFEILYIYES